MKPSVPAPYTLDDFFREAKEKNLTAADIFPAVIERLAEKGDHEAIAALASAAVGGRMKPSVMANTPKPDVADLSPVAFETVARQAETARDYRARASEAKTLRQPSLAREYAKTARAWERAVLAWVPDSAKATGEAA